MRSLICICALAAMACSPAADEGPAVRESDADVASGDASEVSDVSDVAVEVSTACNGSDAYCALRLDQLVFVTTHNANNNREQGGLIPNQTHGLTRQLDDGVRALMLDVWDDDGVTSMCHSDCRLGSRPLADGLREVRDWSDAHPRDVVVFLFETYVPPEAVVQEFEAAGVQHRLLELEAGAEAPTLEELVATGRTWVVFTQDDGGEPGWYHRMWDWLHDTPFSVASSADFTCEHLRGRPENPMLLLNHFITNPVGSENFARVANEEQFLRDRVQECAREFGTTPTFLAVDFYEIGGVVAVADELNQQAAQQ